MAFVNPDENQNGGQGGQGGQGQGSVPSGGHGVGGGGQSVPGVNVPAQPSAQLSAYLSANQPQAAAFGQNVAQKVGDQVTAAGQAIQPAVNTYTSGLNSVPTDAGVNSAVAASPSSLTPEQRAAYQAQLGAAGSSPNSANTFETTAGYQDAAGKIQGAVNQANLWNSGNNVSNLTAALSPFEGATATSGDRTLDSLLLSRTPEAYSQIKAAVAPAANFQDQLTAGTQTANDALHSTIVQNQATTDAARGAAQTYAQNLNQTLAQYLASAQGSVLDYNARLNPISQNYANVQPQISSLQDAVDAYNALLAAGPSQAGVPYDTGNTFSAINLAQPGNLPSTASIPDVAQLATTGQYSDLAALRELLGPDYFSSLNTTVSPDQASLAGSWTPQNNANIQELSALLDPLTSSVIQGLNPNVTAAQGFNPNVQASAPLIQDVHGVQSALDALLAASGQQPWIGPGGQPPAATPPPPPGATPPENGQPASEAWYNYLRTTYPGLGSLPDTYQGYLDQFNHGGIGLL